MNIFVIFGVCVGGVIDFKSFDFYLSVYCYCIYKFLKFNRILYELCFNLGFFFFLMINLLLMFCYNVYYFLKVRYFFVKKDNF